jgi:hydrogenase expression/formation protein HypC
MCIGVPMKVVECNDHMAVCESGARRERLNILLVGPQAAGTWVLSFQGSAVRVMTDDEAQQTNAALAALEAATNGVGDLDAFFADLTAREPVLPPHLRPDTKESET